jgi:enoyl-CoA hydratase/carnithine racemase
VSLTGSIVVERDEGGPEADRGGIVTSREARTASGRARPQFVVDEQSPAYWRVTFGNGPVNLFDVESIDQLGRLVTRVEDSPELRVVVFDSANPDFFVGHWDLTADRARVASLAPGPTGLHPYVDNFVRLSKVPAVTISAIRGRARGTGSEFALATDMRFAGDRAVLGHFEVGIGAVPGGGPMARLARLVGRGRAAEILLGADDIPAELAERYGYVNRMVPDAELSAFVDALAWRVAGFDRDSLVGTKALLDLASLPPDDEFAPGIAAFFRTAGRPTNALRIRYLLESGLQSPTDVELELGRAVGKLATLDGSEFD